MRTDPDVSVPSEITAEPWQSATPAPELDPPGVRCAFASHGLRGVGHWLLRPSAPNANSTVCVLPRMTADASRSVRATGPGDCHCAGSSREEPAKIGTPGTP